MRIVILCMLLLIPSSYLMAQGSVAGTITGTVTDSQGAAIPGAMVTVSSPAMLNPKSQQSVEGGAYLIENLPPGEYEVMCSLPGFKSFVEKGIVLTAGFTATIAISLGVGDTTESVLVSSMGPVVDVQSSTTPATFDTTLLQNTPSGRDPWSTLAQTPGVTTSTFDVAGNNSYQQSQMSVHGSKTTEQVYAFNGLNLSSSSGTAISYYVDYDSFQEIQVVTSAAPPEIPNGGTYMNMITRTGSNAVHGFTSFNYLDDKTQAGIKPPIFTPVGGSPTPVVLAGSPFIRAFDATADVGGPIIKDRWWIFGAYREYQLKQQLRSSPLSNPVSGAPAPPSNPGLYGYGVDTNHQTNTTLRNDFQINSKNVFNAQWLWNYQNRFARRNTSYTYVDQDASYVQIEPAYLLEAQEIYTPTAHLTIDSRIGYVQVVFPERYQPGVAPQTIPAVDIAQSTLKYAGLENYLSRGKQGRLASTASYFHGGWKGSHNFKVGLDFGIGRSYVNYNYNQNIFEYYNSVATTANPNPAVNSIPDYVQVQNGPTKSNVWNHSHSIFVQDAWTLNRRLTFNIGARYDHSHSFIPAQCSPQVSPDGDKYGPLFPNRCLSDFQAAYEAQVAAGTNLGPANNFNNITTYDNVVPRLGVAYDPTGKGSQVIRAGFNMFTLNDGTSFAASVNPNGPSYNQYTWNGSFIPGSATPGAQNSATPDYKQFAPGCTGTNTPVANGCITGGTAPDSYFKGTFGGITTYVNPNLRRPYSVQFNAGYQRSVMGDITVGVAYYFTTTKNQYAPININGPESDYTPVTTYLVKGVPTPITNPYTGRPMTLYTLKPADVGRNYYEITNIAAMNQNRYDGLEFTATRRMINRWQALIGFTMQRERGTYFASNTAGSSEDFNDPNRNINRNGGSLDQDAPYVLRADVTYQLPFEFQTSVNFQHETGYAILPSNTFSGTTYGLTQGSESVKLAPNGALRYDSINDVNLRLARTTHIGERFILESMCDLNNLFNARPITAVTATYGSSFLKPSNFLGPFVARFGVKLSF
jgi:hypothetical protein